MRSDVMENSISTGFYAWESRRNKKETVEEEEEEEDGGREEGKEGVRNEVWGEEEEERKIERSKLEKKRDWK